MKKQTDRQITWYCLHFLCIFILIIIKIYQKKKVLSLLNIILFFSVNSNYFMPFLWIIPTSSTQNERKSGGVYSLFIVEQFFPSVSIKWTKKWNGNPIVLLCAFSYSILWFIHWYNLNYQKNNYNCNMWRDGRDGMDEKIWSNHLSFLSSKPRVPNRILFQSIVL